MQSLVVAGFVSLLVLACNEPPAVNPWRDDSIPEQTWSTPSADSVLVANAQPGIRHRSSPPATAPAVDNSVPHYPLWWEDSFEDVGDGDHQFAWTWQDYFAMPASYGRMIVNTIGFPASIILQPPGASMISDGTVEPRGLSAHDAKLGHSPDPRADKSDFGLDPNDSPLPAASSAPAS